MTDDTITLKIDDKTYTLDPEDLELGEIELLEDEMDSAVADIDFNRGRAMRVLVFIAVHRENPDFSMDDAKRVKISAITDVQQNGNGSAPAGARKRPTKAAKSG
jgi:hypothetical protein